MNRRKYRSDGPVAAPTGCIIRVTRDGKVTVVRDPGCTPDNVRELCAAILDDQLVVIDITQPAAG